MKTKIAILLLAGGFLLGACKGRGSGYSADSKRDNADSVSVPGTDASVQSKLAKTADMRFKVKDVRQTAENIAALTIKNNGMVMHHQMQANITGSQDIHISNDSVMHISSINTVADMTVSIPPDHVEDFMNQVARMGIYVNARKMDIEDKSLDYLSSKLKRNNREAFVAQQNKNVDKDASKELVMKDDIVDNKISNLKIDKESRYSTIILSFYQSNSVVKEVVANDDPAAYQLPLFKRLISSLAYGWSVFAELILWLANLWVFILAGIGIWLLFRFYKRKHPAWFGAIKS
ncbi:MAG: hypothetical protein JWR38_3122 [Mucilaginibacter sp.]|nr:hypothetical protein [Mucilaginibacter sp.]